jgi:hypothetical protein
MMKMIASYSMSDGNKEQNLEQWPAARTVHLVGGCRAICGLEPRIEVVPKALSGKVLTAELSDYGALYSTLESGNVEIVGVDFISDLRQADGRTPAEWRVYHKRTKERPTAWPCEDVTQKWADIGKSAYNEKIGRLWDLARRISHQLRVCGWRLRQISEAYYQQLNAEIHNENGFKVGRRFDNAFVWQSYVAIHAFLVDACILRDYLVEFAAHFVYGPRLGMATITVTTAAGLKKLLSKLADADELAASLRSAIAENGWLRELGAYRDLVIHVAPLARAEQRLFANTGTLLVDGSDHLPFTNCPIPDDPEKIMASRTRGDFFNDFAAQWETYGKGNNRDLPSRDALTYCHMALGKLTELAESLSVHSPVMPKKMLFELSNNDAPATVNFIE